MTSSTLKKSLLLIAPVALIAALVSPVSANAADATRYITVSAEGTVKVAPDAVRLTATASSVAPTNKEALATTSTNAAAVRKALVAAGISIKDIATQNITVYPEYKYDTNGGSTLVGYRGTQLFSVVIRAAANAGAVVDAVVASAGDSVQINSVTPFLLDAAKAAESARAVAVKNARAKAISYAKLLGVKLGKVNYLSENGSPSISVPVFAAAAKAEDASTVVDLGQQDVTVSITVQWAL
ncbi:MAG: SIMPL domain-containing protein [Candidatus Planktophila sp.]